MAMNASTSKSSKAKLGSGQHAAFGKYLYERPWVLPVPILPDESLSSWLTRSALTQGCDPLVLTGVVWPDWRIWTIDLDRGLGDDQLSSLVSVSGIPASTFKEVGLCHIVSKTTQEPLESLAIWPWVLALGARNRKRYGGLQYCPLCLKEDKFPYHRLHWRLAWHTSCLKHGIALIDKCPHCNAPIEPHRLIATDNNLAVCATCKQNLSESATDKIVSGALDFQQATNSVLMSGKGDYGNIQLHTNGWFALARYFVLLLRQAARRPTSKLVGFMEEIGVSNENLCSPSTGLKFEMLPVTERAMLLAGVWKLLLAGPEKFLDAAIKVCLTQACIDNPRQPAPPPILEFVQSLPRINITKHQKATSPLPKPRTRESVLRMYARLQRKVRVGK